MPLCISRLPAALSSNTQENLCKTLGESGSVTINVPIVVPGSLFSLTSDWLIIMLTGASFTFRMDILNVLEKALMVVFGATAVMITEIEDVVS